MGENVGVCECIASINNALLLKLLQQLRTFNK